METILPYNHGAYSPRSLVTISVQSAGALPRSCSSSLSQCGSHAPFCSAPTTFHATGMTQTRYTTLMHNTVKRFFNVFASSASASRG